MTDLRTAAQQALEALEFFRDTAICSADTEAASEAITALRAALAEPQVWVCPEAFDTHRYAKPGHCEDCGRTLVLAHGIQE